MNRPRSPKPPPSPAVQAEFSDLLVPILPELHRLGSWLTRDPALAEDLVQEASFRAFRAFEQFQRGTNFKAWIFRIAYNYFRDLQRRSKHAARSTDFEEYEPEDTATTEPDFEEIDFQRLDDLDPLTAHLDETVSSAIEELPDKYRTVFLLFVLGGLSYQEIADNLEIPIGTVMSRLYRARQRLSKKLVAYAAERGYVERQST